MKKEHIFAFKITFFIIIIIILSSFISFFLFSNFTSIFEFFWNIKKEFIKSPEKFLNAFFALIITSFWIYFIIYMFLKNHFLKIDEYNKNLKDYNHYLAHELKTPISVICSNLEVLKYNFDEKILKNSQNELKNISLIIDGLLNFSESVNIAEREDINLENFLKTYIKKYFLKESENIFIDNREFNFYIKTNEILFRRIIRNLLDNAIKYSFDNKIFIKIENKKLVFENKIEKNISENDLKKFVSKFYRKQKNFDNWYWLWLALIKEILKFLWYWFKIYSKENKFFVEIDFWLEIKKNI